MNKPALVASKVRPEMTWKIYRNGYCLLDNNGKAKSLLEHFPSNAHTMLRSMLRKEILELLPTIRRG